MKKIIWILVMSFLVFGSSCEKDDTSPNNSSSSCSLTAINYPSWDLEYEYSNNLISKTITLSEIGTITGYMLYEYSNSILSKTKEYNDGSLSWETRYIIEGNKVVEAIFYWNNLDGELNPDGSSTKYYYNDNNDLLKIESLLQGNVSKKIEYVWENSNVKEKKYFYEEQGVLELSSTETYTYDDKKNVYRTGIKDWEKSKNNVLIETEIDVQDNTTEVKEYTYEYNLSGYPTKRTKTINGSSSVTEYIYNCN